MAATSNGAPAPKPVRCAIYTRKSTDEGLNQDFNSTIAAFGVITRMPRVCISMVASAFQYGCAPTLIPLINRFTSPPACVNSINRRRTRAIQSMFSTPLSIEIFAPAEIGNHSTGKPCSAAISSAATIRRHSGSASRAQILAGISQQQNALHALGIPGWRTLGTKLGLFWYI